MIAPAASPFEAALDAIRAARVLFAAHEALMKDTDWRGVIESFERGLTFYLAARLAGVRGKRLAAIRADIGRRAGQLQELIALLNARVAAAGAQGGYSTTEANPVRHTVH